jgi:NADPH-dependent ferric siderophore reductase
MSEEETYEPKYHAAGVCEVVRAEMLTPRVRRITLYGTALEGLKGHWRPEMLIRLYFPPTGYDSPPEPFLTPDGELNFRTTAETEVSAFSAFSEDPLVRAYTARRFSRDTLELTIDFALHDDPGLASDWARDAKVGDRLGVVEFALPSGHRPAIAHEADVFVFCADEASFPSAQTNLEAIAPGSKVIAFFEVADELEEQPIDTEANLTVTWLHRGDAEPGTSGLLVNAIRDLPWPEGKVFVWVCGEMKMATEIRKFIIEERGLQRGDFKCQAYWRRGKTEVERMARMTELSLAVAETNPDAFMESFEDIGMNIIDPTLFGEPEQEVTTKDDALESNLPAESALPDGNGRLLAYDKWEINMKTPLGTQKATLYLFIEGDMISGRMESPVGSSDVIEGRVENETLSWKVYVKFIRKLTFEFTAKVDGDSMSGKIKLGPLGQATFKGTKAQDEGT